MKNELTETARSSENDFETSATVLMERDDVFYLGHDLKDPWLSDIDQLGLAERQKATQVGPRLTKVIEEVEPVTIFAIEGMRVGGGVALAAVCNFLIMEKSARM